MTIHREGKKYLLISSFIWILSTGIMFLFVDLVWLNLLVSAFFLFFLIAFLQFFRLPRRNFSLMPDHVMAPCDGKVVVIEKVFETEYFNTEMIQLSIFMSPVNVHANWYPISGQVKYVKYHPGKYLVAWHPKSSTENERSTIVIERPDGVQVLVRQIAGYVARKIVIYAKEKMIVQQGQELGFIKFGSRVDVLLPLDCEINVQIGQKTIGGITPVAKLNTRNEKTV